MLREWDSWEGTDPATLVEESMTDNLDGTETVVVRSTIRIDASDPRGHLRVRMVGLGG